MSITSLVNQSSSNQLFDRFRVIPYICSGGGRIDNNLVGNATPFRRSWKEEPLFFGEADAGKRSAIIYSIIESCRRHDIEPYTRCVAHRGGKSVPVTLFREGLEETSAFQPGMTLSIIELQVRCSHRRTAADRIFHP